jgi:hypothetical protein
MMDLDSLEPGEPLTTPMHESQKYWIEQLLITSILTEEQREGYRMAITYPLTENEANNLIEELYRYQIDDINLARDGRLKEKPLARAIRRLLNFDNT